MNENFEEKNHNTTQNSNISYIDDIHNSSSPHNEVNIKSANKITFNFSDTLKKLHSIINYLDQIFPWNEFLFFLMWSYLLFTYFINK